MKRTIALSLLALSILFTTSAIAQTSAKGKVPPNSKVYVSKMQNELDGFLTTEIIKKKIPFTLVTDEKEAEFILVGASIKGDDKWYHSVFGGKDKNEGNVQLISVKDKTIVWAGEAGDRSLLWGGFRRGGQRKVADRLASKMKKELFK